MSEQQTSSNGTSPYKKISNSQFNDLLESLKKRGISISDEDKSGLISDGVVVSRTREKTRRGWIMEDGSKVYPSLSFKGLNGKTATEEMENFRSMYYELLTENVEVVTS
tara:strand:- start:271 stop:597 length:327 start_codon:yes stop_codon:yes gene_type:complete